MDVKHVTQQLKTNYPGCQIILNNKEKPTEIVCELVPASTNPHQSIAVAVINKSIPHYHSKTTETYEVFKGNLKLVVDGKEMLMKPGDKYTIHPGSQHHAEGHQTWVKCTSCPGWIIQDHILVE